MTYLDTSALLSLVLTDARSVTMLAWVGATSPAIATSTFAKAEFNAVVARGVRAGTLAAEPGGRAMSAFDGWLATEGSLLDLDAADARLAAVFVQRAALGLRAPDALHIAICHRLGLPMLTFDRRQAAAAQALGVACVEAAAG